MRDMSSGTEELEEVRELYTMLVQVADRAKADFAVIVAGLGISLPLAKAIVALSAPAPMRDLAEQLACDRSYITGLADQMEERGLVERVPGTDRRVKLLQLTEKGVETRAQISEAVGRGALVQRRLTPQQRSTLRPILEALLQEE
jgi:DNA-binding MarR family transcriptional regulator